MHCPNCSTQILAEQKFCRVCGRSLDAVFKVPLEQISVPDSGEPMARVTKRMPARRMSRMLLWGLVIIGLGVTLLVNAQGNELINGAGILVFLAGVGLAIYGAFSQGKAKSLPTDRLSSQPKTLNQAERSPSLPSKDFSEPMPSVTERTTELLEVENTKAPK
jgi:zinc-ribbon domain